MTEQQPTITVNDLPTSFDVKYLGHRPASGLWGIKHFRKPVDDLVEATKKGKILPFVKIIIDKDGLSFRKIAEGNVYDSATTFKVETISYGVQDPKYTKVFCMIIVDDNSNFDCHAFLCDTKNQAIQLTAALNATFQYYKQKVMEKKIEETRN